MDINYFKSKIYNGMIFSKIKRKTNIIKVMNDGFTYAIGEHGNNKKVTFSEVEQTIIEIEKTGVINRKWYEKTFPKRSKSNPCNFTSIGGVLEELGYVKYIESKYVKLNVERYQRGRSYD